MSNYTKWEQCDDLLVCITYTYLSSKLLGIEKVIALSTLVSVLSFDLTFSKQSHSSPIDYQIITFASIYLW